jgi:hypothetical protein
MLAGGTTSLKFDRSQYPAQVTNRTDLRLPRLGWAGLMICITHAENQWVLEQKTWKAPTTLHTCLKVLFVSFYNNNVT